MTTQKPISYMLLTLLVVACGCGAAQAQAPTKAKKAQYNVSNLASLGGTSSGGNTINNLSWVAGYSRLPNRNRHATLWRNGLLTDLGTLGGPNSSVTWNVKNTAGTPRGLSPTPASPTTRRGSGDGGLLPTPRQNGC